MSFAHRLLLFAAPAAFLVGWVAGAENAPPPRAPATVPGTAADACIVHRVVSDYKVGDPVRVSFPGSPHDGRSGIVAALWAGDGPCHLVEINGVGHAVPPYHLTHMPKVGP